MILRFLLYRPEVCEFFQLDRHKLTSEETSVEDGEEEIGGSDVTDNNDKLNLGPSERSQ
jgi:hypothetical protein